MFIKIFWFVFQCQLFLSLFSIGVWGVAITAMPLAIVFDYNGISNLGMVGFIISSILALNLWIGLISEVRNNKNER